jgi:hypothetical protein
MYKYNDGPYSSGNADLKILIEVNWLKMFEKQKNNRCKAKASSKILNMLFALLFLFIRLSIKRKKACEAPIIYRISMLFYL